LPWKTKDCLKGEAYGGLLWCCNHLFRGGRKKSFLFWWFFVGFVCPLFFAFGFSVYLVV
jgi:hypothetical protein